MCPRFGKKKWKKKIRNLFLLQIVFCDFYFVITFNTMDIHLLVPTTNMLCDREKLHCCKYLSPNHIHSDGPISKLPNDHFELHEHKFKAFQAHPFRWAHFKTSK